MMIGEKKRNPSAGNRLGHRAPRKMTPARLENIALHYLDRFSTSSENLRQVLSRRAWKSAQHHDLDLAECDAWIDTMIGRYLNSGLLDDAAYAHAQTVSHNRRGKSIRAIRALLRKKGLAAPIIDEALQGLGDQRDDPDLAAAKAYARRRHFGPYRTRDIDDKGREKELAALARAGFSYAIARRITSADRVEEIDDDG